ncbi:septal ring lytic transglycosylase RlpA family lipoprotein [Helicobacter monodelphidis]|uniref:septal ring lytic transglycosylase RlpA family protein n=1 Tax=Helicobacter sp. 15-1451 TaxID=2004995 RepID=UPI000DCD8112|nr:septal ring lytic transglycosylase RlpA family protein [Helicobacter sp. 15-1451]RAX58871.1 septal ring lytic transglycosylase RlpA family lipoprotein [Helicobacter sp. 15-1451]
MVRFKRILGSIGVCFLLILAGCADPDTPIDYPTEVGNIPENAQSGPGTMKPYQINGIWYYPSQVAVGAEESGLASWYGPNFHGRKTSNGETYSMYAKTAAHKTYPMNTIVKVTNKNNNLSTVVRINDRGPFVAGRIIDLSQSAAQEIDMIKTGTAPVSIEVLGFNGIISSDSDALPQVSVDSQEFPVGKIETTVSLSRFLVQIGAFRKKSGAEYYKKEHSNMRGYTAVVREFQLDGAPIYRVMLSGFKSENEARDFISNEPSLRGAFIITE